MRHARSRQIFNFSWFGRKFEVVIRSLRVSKGSVRPAKTWLVLAPLLCALLANQALFAQSQNPDAATIISRDVLVAEGDTLRSLAKRELGRTGLAPQLAQFNDLVESAPLVPGNIIRIPIQVPQRGEFAEIVFIKGDVFAERSSPAAASPDQPVASTSGDTDSSAQDNAPATDSIKLERNAEVRAGDVISTGPEGYLTIEFSSGSVVNMQPETDATIIRLNCLPNDDSCLIEINTSRGKITSDVESRDSQPVDFRINTPYASAAVRGTVFDMSAQDDTLGVGVTEGLVDISAQQKTVNLGQGFGSIVKEGEEPAEPIALLPAPVFKRVPTRVAPGDLVTWWTFADAAEYGALLSIDEEGKETLASYSVDTDFIDFQSIESGDYFLILRAVDTNGLQGFTSNTRLTLAEIDPDTPAVQTSISKQGREFLVSIIDPPNDAAGFEIQISNTEQFSDPLSVDVNNKGTAVFRLDNDQVYSRARVLIDPFTVSDYGSVANSGN